MGRTVDHGLEDVPGHGAGLTSASRLSQPWTLYSSSSNQAKLADRTSRWTIVGKGTDEDGLVEKNLEFVSNAFDDGLPQ